MLHVFSILTLVFSVLWPEIQRKINTYLFWHIVMLGTPEKSSETVFWNRSKTFFISLNSSEMVLEFPANNVWSFHLNGSKSFHSKGYLVLTKCYLVIIAAWMLPITFSSNVSGHKGAVLKKPAWLNIQAGLLVYVVFQKTILKFSPQ